MHPIEFINAVEDRNGGKHGEPSLGEALNLWRLRWTSGLRDRETALHLMFLSWYSCAEPPYFTGLPCSGAFKEIFLEAFESLSGKESGDVEVCYVVGVMASLFPWCLGKDEHWTQVGAELLRRVGLQDSLRIQGVTFANRGAYGRYFVSARQTHLEARCRAGKDGAHLNLRWTRWNRRESGVGGTVRNS